MSGIIFLKTKNMENITDFYLNEVGMELWLKQQNIALMRHGNLILGMHNTNEVDQFGLITFFYPTMTEVDAMYEKFKDRAITQPKINETYQIYNFFARDPEDRKLEFQAFLHPLKPYMAGDEALITRRSVRHFQDKDVPDEVLWQIFETCRYSPTSRNSESYRYFVFRKQKDLEYMAGIREESSAPIANAPMAVAICAKQEKSKRHVEDACIAAYHFMVAAWMHGLGTCWIGGMDDYTMKLLMDMIGYYVATVTPLGYPAEPIKIPQRREAKEFVTFV